MIYSLTFSDNEHKYEATLLKIQKMLPVLAFIDDMQMEYKVTQPT